MIFLIQFGINKHLLRPQIALALQACTILLVLKKNLLMLIYSKFHLRSCDYLYKLHHVLLWIASFSKSMWKLY